MHHVMAAVALAVVIAACTQPVPSPRPPDATSTPEPPPAAAPAPVCSGVGAAQCSEVLAAAVHNLARTQSAFIGPGTVATAVCPEPLPAYYAVDTPCWHVTLPLRTGITPQVVMARRDDGVITQAGGDSISGAATIPGDDAEVGSVDACGGGALRTGTVVAAFTTTVAEIQQLPVVGDSALLAEYAGEQAATLCYVDGELSEDAAPAPSGTASPSFDRAMLVVVGDATVLVWRGYQSEMLIQAP